VFGAVLKSSRLPLSIPQALHGSEVNGARVGSWRGCLVRSLLGDNVFPRGGCGGQASLPPAPPYGP
jgi:hypothetical protein